MNITLAESTAPLSNKIRLVIALTIWALVIGPLLVVVLINIASIAQIGWAYSVKVLIESIEINLMIYDIGSGPALLAGVLLGIGVATLASRIRFTWLPRLLLGGASAAVSCLIVGLLVDEQPIYFLHTFGVPAGAIGAVLYQLKWIERQLFTLPKQRLKVANRTARLAP